MVSVCTVPARGGRSCERFGGYKTINRIPLPLLPLYEWCMNEWVKQNDMQGYPTLIYMIYNSSTHLNIQLIYTC